METLIEKAGDAGDTMATMPVWATIVLAIAIVMALFILLKYFLREVKGVLLIPSNGIKGIRGFKIKLLIRKRNKKLSKEAKAFAIRMNSGNPEVREKANTAYIDKKINKLKTKNKKGK